LRNKIKYTNKKNNLKTNCYLKKLGLIRRRIIHDAPKRAKTAITLPTICFQDFTFPSIHLIAPLVILTPATTTITKEKISIAVTSILLKPPISLGKALREVVLVVVQAEGPSFIWIQSPINGTIVFNSIHSQGVF
jgi:hypothetical protein